jgi:hypothetical protein
MPTYTFQEIRRTKTVRFKCACGKRFQRKVAETQTINPFNRNADGTQKTYPEIWISLGVKLQDRMPRSECPGCDQQAAVVSSLIEGYGG